MQPLARLALLLVLAACAAAGATLASARPAATALEGTVGPDFVITLKDAQGNRVTTLPEGDYTITVKDLSEFHNFHLVGPGVNEATDVETTGTVTWNVHLKSGTYTFQCDPHASQMKGSVKVGTAATETTTTTPTGGTAAPKAPVVVGTVGPGYSIHLTKGGKRVKSLKAGRYAFKITDRAAVHNFVLEKSKGGTFERAITSVPFKGTKTVVVKLTKGSWEFYCAPHESTMHGDFTVT